MSTVVANDDGMGTSARGAAPARAPGASAVLLATAPAGDGPAAALPWGGGTVLARLLQQLGGLGVRDVHVITRASWAPALEALLVHAGASARLHASASAATDLLAVAEIARAADGPVVVAHGDIVTQGEVLSRLLADPRVPTGILTSKRAIARPFAFRTRGGRGRVLSAASPYHAVRAPNGTFLGVLKVGAADQARLVEVAERLAALVADLPPAWAEELAAKGERWHRWLAVMAIVRTGGDAPPVEARDDLPLAPEDQAMLARRLALAADDVTALLLVGLVRAGTVIRVSRLRGLFWARPLSDLEVSAAREQITQHDEERALLDSTVKGSDGVFTTFFVSPYSKYIARWAARRGLTPNTVTWISMAVGLVAAAAFATGDRAGLVAGALLLQLAFTLDCVDGQLARYTRTFSKLGAWLDSMFDRTKEYLAFAGLAIGASRAGDPVWALAIAALAVQTTRHAVDFSYPTVRRQRMDLAPQPPLEEPLDGPRWARPVEALEAGEPAPAVAEERRGLRRRVLALWKAGDRSRRVLYLKKLIAFPIGERFAVISLSAALFSPRTTFIVLLAWAGFALAYVLSGRLLRSFGA